MYNDKQISRLDTAYWKSAGENKKMDAQNWRGDDKILKDLEDRKAFIRNYNSIFLNSIFLQTILTFVAQIIGYKATKAKKTYKWTAITFGILFVVNLWLEILMAIVPTGALV